MLGGIIYDDSRDASFSIAFRKIEFNWVRFGRRLSGNFSNKLELFSETTRSSAESKKLLQLIFWRRKTKQVAVTPTTSIRFLRCQNVKE
jgi:hypothetical protein